MSAAARLAPDGNFTQTVLKALDVLEYLADADRALTAQEVALGCGLSRTTAHRLLTTLLTRGYVASAGEGQYRLGSGILRLRHRLLDRLDLPAAAKPELREICRRCDETAYLAVLDGAEILYLDRVESSHSIRLRSSVGTRGALHSTSLGKAILAFLPPDERAALLDGTILTRRTARTITDRAALEAHLGLVRERGFAIDDIENEDGVRCLSAPVFGHDGRVVAAVSVSGPAFRLSAERLIAFAPVVTRAADGVSAGLGFLPRGDEAVGPAGGQRMNGVVGGGEGAPSRQEVATSAR